MSDGLTDYRSMYDRPVHWFETPGGGYVPNRALSMDEYRRNPPPIVPRRVTEHGRMMWAADLGLPSNNTPPYFWLGREAE